MCDCSVQLFQPSGTDSDRLGSSDSSSVGSGSSSRCCCHGNQMLSTGHCDSGLSSALSDVAAAHRIAEMEAELAQLRQQLALIVLQQEQGSQPGE